MKTNKKKNTKANYKVRHVFRRLHNLKKKYERVKKYYMAPKECQFCSAPLSYEQRSQTFCSKSCSSSAVHTGRPKTWIFTCCNFCHKSLWGSHRLQVKFCNAKCYQADRWRQMVEDIEENGAANDSRTAKKYLLQVRGHQCEECRAKRRKGKRIAIQIHHINGDSEDHRIDNLQLLCSLCHEDTDTYCGKKHRLRIEQHSKHVH